ncbi:HAD family phosphatase [Treponema berlinense]|uniref:HAD family hydrolase n=1 Tax=Treponema berlinense TaxID=225004 RepID=UPI0026EDB5B7|nr:HAD family phosphatase [Treponema berlinense]
MDFKGAIFDLDGTLLDSMDMWLNAGELFLESLGIKAEEGLGAALLQMNVEEGALYIQKKYGLELTCKEISEGTAAVVKKTYAEKIQPKDGAVEFLQLLEEKKIPCAILTGSDREMFDGCLKKQGLEKFFKKILTCSELKMSKSNPEIYSVAAEILGTRAHQTLVFEDAPEAIKSAGKAGFFTIGIFDQCTHSNSDICSARKNSRFFCRDFFEAADFLRKQGLL